MLANASMIRSFRGRTISVKTAALRNFTLKQGDGYNLLPPFPIDWRYCPVFLVNDIKLLSISGEFAQFFRKLSVISEHSTFQKKIARLPAHVAAMWLKVKERLSITTASPGTDFKPWERTKSGTIYSVRLNRQYRAHILHQASEWIALDIGTHKQMGHG